MQVFDNINSKECFCNIYALWKFFSSRNWYHNATAPISTVLFTLCPMSWRNVIELIQNWDNQNQQAKSFRIRYNLSKLNNRNYQTLTWGLAIYNEICLDNKLSRAKLICKLAGNLHPRTLIKKAQTRSYPYGIFG